MKASSIALLLLVSSAATALAQTSQVPELLSYQASVTDAAGTAIGATGPVNRTVTFQFYTTSTGGTPVYAESQVVTIANGDFSVLLGNGNGVSGLPGRVGPADPIRSLSSITLSPLYLGITVDDGIENNVDVEISPRQQLASAAFATRAQIAEGLADGKLATGMVADSAITTVKIGGNQVTTAKIADSNITTAKLATGSVTLDKLDTTAIGVWTPNGPNINRTSGNVGIGQPNPGFPLNFASTTGNKIALHGNSGAHYGFGIGSNLLQLYTPASSADVAFGYGSSTAFTETMRIRGNGNLGIGTTAPSSKLHVVGGSATIDSATNTALSILQGGGTGKVDLAVAGGAGAYSSSAATNDGVLRAFGKLHLQTGSGSAGITVDAANNVGMGNTAPNAKLTVGNNLGGSALSSTLNTNSGALGTTGGNELLLANFGCTTSNSSSLGVSAYRRANGTDWTTTTMILGMNVDNTKRVGGYLALNSSGIGVNTTDSSQGPFSVNGTATIIGRRDSNGSTAYFRMYYEGGGRIVFDCNNVSQNSGVRGFSYDGDNNLDWRSDRRLKQDITNAEPMLERLMELPMRRYHWKSEDGKPGKHEFGVIAQEVEPLFPDLIGKGDDGYLTVGNTAFGMIAVKGLQELKIEKDREIDELREDLDRKDAELADLTDRLLALEKLVSGNR